jgi:hypothetical protein
MAMQFITKLLGVGLGWKTYLAVGGVLLVAGFGGGYYVKDKFCDAASARVSLNLANQRIAALQDNLRVIRKAQEQDNTLATAQTARLAELERIHRDLLSEISDGVCFTPADVDRLRRGWTVPKI